jgi:glycine dehydrogenase subunit 2
VSELQAVRHFTRLSQLNFSIDTHFYPLGSCTMKYNPRACNQFAMLPEFSAAIRSAPESASQGFLACMFELQEMLKEVTGMKGVSLTPMAGAQGEFAGVAMIRAYHRARGDMERTEIIVPDAAHGTNPATATMCGCTVVEIPSLPNGDIDVEALKQALGPKTAGIMLTNPSTLGVFERRIQESREARARRGRPAVLRRRELNAILGKVRPGDMGFDVIHMNLHKTFSTPHGGGGPGPVRSASASACCRSCRFRSSGATGDRYRWLDERDLPQTIGRLSAFMGTRACCCVLTSTCGCSVAQACSGSPNMRRSMRTTCSRACSRRASTPRTRPPREPRVHHHAQAPGEAARRERDGLRQAAARHGFQRRRRTSRCSCRSAC